MKLLLFIRISIWVIFVLLLVYVYFSIKKEDFSEKYTNSIRKVWYLIYVLGSVISIYFNPFSILSDWTKYLIVLICFIVIDSIFFLNLYVGKLAGYELKQTEKQIVLTQEKYDRFIQKSNNISKTLHSFDFPVYNVSRKEYLYHLERLLNSYGNDEGFDISILPYRNKNEEDQALEDFGRRKDKVRRILEYKKVFISLKDDLALYRYKIHGETYIVQLKTNEDEPITEIDGNAISILIMAFALKVGITNESGDDENGNS